MKKYFVITALFLMLQYSNAQVYVYDHNKYDSLFKTKEYFDVIDTVYSDSSIFIYQINYNYNLHPNGNYVYITSFRKIEIELIEFLSEHFSDTNAIKNDSITQKLFNYLNKQGIYFFISSNLFISSYFYKYRLPCAPSTNGLNNSRKSLETMNQYLYSITALNCDRYLLIKWKTPDLFFGLRGLRFPVYMKDQLIMVEFPMGIEDNYCNRE